MSPPKVEALAGNISTVSVTWDPPSMANGPLSLYQVRADWDGGSLTWNTTDTTGMFSVPCPNGIQYNDIPRPPAKIYLGYTVAGHATHEMIVLAQYQNINNLLILSVHHNSEVKYLMDK